MGKSLMSNFGSNSVLDNNTEYEPICGAFRSNTTITDSEIPNREAGVFSNLFTYVSNNTTLVTSTITFLDTQIATALTVSYGSGETGIKEDTSNSASLANTDTAQYEIAVPDDVSGAKTILVKMLGVEFTPTDTNNTVINSGAVGSASFSSASVTRFIGLYNTQPTLSTSETNSSFLARDSFTSSNLSVYVPINSRSSSSTSYGTRSGGSAGNQSVSFAASETGTKEDTSNTDALIAGTQFGGSMTTGAGTQGITTRIVTHKLLSTSSEFAMLAGAIAGKSQGQNVSNFLGIQGEISLAGITNESLAEIYPRFNFTAYELSANVSANTFGSLDTTITLRDNEGDSAIKLTYGAGETGFKSDTTNTAEITLGVDEIDYNIVTPNEAGSATFRFVGVFGTTAVTTPSTAPTIRRFRPFMG